MFQLIYTYALRFCVFSCSSAKAFSIAIAVLNCATGNMSDTMDRIHA